MNNLVLHMLIISLFLNLTTSCDCRCECFDKIFALLPDFKDPNNTECFCKQPLITSTTPVTTRVPTTEEPTTTEAGATTTPTIPTSTTTTATTTTTTTTPFTGACSISLDFYFIVDVSTTSTNIIDLWKYFMKSLTDELDIGENKVRPGIIVFDDEVRSAQSLLVGGDIITRSEYEQHIDNIMVGNSPTSDILKLLQFMNDLQSSDPNNRRMGIILSNYYPVSANDPIIDTSGLADLAAFERDEMVSYASVTDRRYFPENNNIESLRVNMRWTYMQLVVGSAANAFYFHNPGIGFPTSTAYNITDTVPQLTPIICPSVK